MLALNKKYQTTVNRVVLWNNKYNTLVEQGREESQRGECAYDKLMSYWSELPKREQINLNKNGVHI